MENPSEDLDIPPLWQEAADSLAGMPGARILIVGAADTGKSSLFRYLAGRFRERGLPPALLDADPGQKDLGPPAAITLTPPGSGDPVDRWRRLYFVGAVSPRGHLLPLLTGATVLAGSSRSRPLLVNTPGLLKGPGQPLLEYLTEALRPDAVVALEQEGEAEAVLSGCLVPTVLRLGPSSAARRKNTRERRRIRERAFRAHFSGSRRLVLPLAGLALQRTRLFSGHPVVPEGGVHAEETSEGKLAVADSPTARGKGLRVLPPGFEEGLLCGVIDRQGEGIGLARLARFDFGRGTVALDTPALPSEIGGLQLGDLYLGPNGEELNKTRPSPL